MSDQHATYGTKVIVATRREAHYVLDEILGNATDLPITEHATDTHGVTLVNFGLFDLLGLQLSPRIRDLGRITLYRPGPRAEAETRFPHAGSLLTRRCNLDLIAEHYDDLLRLAGSLKFGHATASLLVGKLSASGRQNALAAALKEYGALCRTIYVLVTWNLSVGPSMLPPHDHELWRRVGQHDGCLGEEVAGPDPAPASGRVAAGVGRSRPGAPHDRRLRSWADRVPDDVRARSRRSAHRESGAHRGLCA